uniref:Uncharacterized protein n=1 Tax=Caenorhabditis japonica TaxID=281687 RepID=A0A8R1EB73_CAEJA
MFMNTASDNEKNLKKAVNRPALKDKKIHAHENAQPHVFKPVKQKVVKTPYYQNIHMKAEAIAQLSENNTSTHAIHGILG